ncbi:hypothetical protein GQ602_006342 [Ophiocordyceps camponoti-floridani]|uniref:Uncharacterized protein n=1 Tax=Ophiocordyceps camponoti-floridani TaxID=2030778 RepID=A0A8H4Q343_9HYPO|nr:hypothetical protein GQ602_006342 [Ophiocordyceps camponoti-floridani]
MDDEAEREIFFQKRMHAANVFLALMAALMTCSVIYWLVARRKRRQQQPQPQFTKRTRAHEMGGFHQGAGHWPRRGTTATLPPYGDSLPATPPPAYGSWTGRLLRPLTLLPGRSGSLSLHHNSPRGSSSRRGGHDRNDSIQEEANVGIDDDGAHGRKEQAKHDGYSGHDSRV